MTVPQDIVIIFTRYPEPGKCKTRLIPAIGPDKAAQLVRTMTGDIVAKLTRHTLCNPCKMEIHYTGGSLPLMQKWLGQYHYQQQIQGDLGQRMSTAIIRHLGLARSILLIGSDCPDLNSQHLNLALNSLQQHDTVIGPAFDGGYYLIGVNGTIAPETCISLFQDISWGTNKVFEATINKLKKLQLSCFHLESLHDIDTPDDLRYLDHHSHIE